MRAMNQGTNVEGIMSKNCKNLNGPFSYLIKKQSNNPMLGVNGLTTFYTDTFSYRVTTLAK